MQKKQEYTLNTQQNKKAEKRIIAEVIIAIILIAPAILLCVGWRKLIISLILQKVELKPNSVGFQTWLHPPTTITRGYHLFNISNPREIVT
ncbi:unnamed protein product, partial [Rotaria magnacalcarata]